MWKENRGRKENTMWKEKKIERKIEGERSKEDEWQVVGKGMLASKQKKEQLKGEDIKGRERRIEVGRKRKTKDCMRRKL
jgi:hypothetical protein